MEMKGKTIRKIGIASPAILLFLFFFLCIAMVLYPLNAAAEAIRIAKEDVGSFFERLGNVLIFRGWCTASECFEKEEKDYYKKVADLNEKYSKDPYKLKLNISLIQATIFYGADYEKLFDPDAVDLNEESGAVSKAGKFDYRAAKNQIQDLINHLVYQDKNGKYYQDVKQYDKYLLDSYIEDNFSDLLSRTSKDQILKEIHMIAGYYESTDTEIINVRDNITGSILDLIDPPFRDTECGITSGYTSSRGTSGKSHFAVDVVGESNKNIYSVADGIVVGVNVFTQNLYSKWDPIAKMCDCGGKSCENGYGTYIVIEHTLNGQKYRSRYAHLSQLLVRDGDKVYKGQQIAVEGNTGCSTGSHLHFEFYDLGGHKFDPTPIMDRCATQSAAINACNLNNLKVRLTTCTTDYATPSSPVINELSFKDYVMGVMYGELYANLDQPEFLKAMAVVIQTFTLKRGGYAANSNYIYLRDCSADQNYKDINTASPGAKAAIETAVNAVFGQVLLKNGELMNGSYENNDYGICGAQQNSICQAEANDLAKNKSMKEIILNYYTIPDIVDYCTKVASQSVSGISNDKANIPCGNYANEGVTEVNKRLETKVNNAGRGTRAGVVAAARFLTLEIAYKIPYFSGDSPTTGRYYKLGLNTDAQTGWGCLVNKTGNPTTAQVPGGIYPNGLDSSGFVSWALLNGGIGKGDLSGESLANLGSASVPFGDDRIINGTVKIGDLFWDGGHVGIIIGINDNNIYVAEEKGTDSGLVVTTYTKVDKTAGNFYILMNNVYSQDGKIPLMW